MSYWDKYRSDDPRRIPPLEALALGCYFAELTETVTAPEVPAGALLPHLLNGCTPSPLTEAAGTGEARL